VNWGAQFSMALNSIVVEQSKKELSIQRNSSFQRQDFTYTDTFTLDGEECENMGMMDMLKVSTVVWNEDKKSLKINTSIEMQDGSEMTLIENLAMDGDHLAMDGDHLIMNPSASSYRLRTGLPLRGLISSCEGRRILY
jgi:hypothetical protein